MQEALQEIGLAAELGADDMIANYEKIYNDLFEKEK